MGMAVIQYKLYPKEGADLAKLLDDVLKVPKMKGAKREPVAFGIEVIKCNAMVDDKKDKPEEVEDAIRKLEGVNEVECTDVTLIS